MSTSTKLNAILNSKESIRQAIISKGVACDSNVVLSQYASKINQISVGIGGGISNVKNVPTVTYITHTGEVLMRCPSSEFNVSMIPNAPQVTGLIFDGWNIDLTTDFDSTKSHLVGAMYSTDSGNTEIFIEILPTQTDKTIKLQTSNQSGTTHVINWGDNTSTTISSQNDTITTKTYTSFGNFKITISRASGNGKYCLSTQQNGLGLFTNSAYANKVLKIHIGNNCLLSNNLCCYCFSLHTVTIPYGVTIVQAGNFNYCYGLTCVVIPKGAILIGNSCFSGCYSLRYVSIPREITIIWPYTFSDCRSLVELIIPDNVSEIHDYATMCCYSLKTIQLPSKLVLLKTRAITDLCSLENIYMPSTSVPTFSTNSLYLINVNTKIYVLDNLLDAYKTATNATAFANYFYPLSSRPIYPEMP